jgi:hypothetical protein
MLEAKKPLAVFHDLVFADQVEDEIETSFSRHVGQERLIRHEERTLWPAGRTVAGRLALGTRVRLFALPGEAWRFKAYLLLRKAAMGQPWSDALETFEGLLLGYTEEEVAARIKDFHETRGGWGAVPAYLNVSRADLEKLGALGFRALPVNLAVDVAVNLNRKLVLILADCRPPDDVLCSAFGSMPATLVRFSLETKFATTLPGEQMAAARIVRLDHGSIAELNRNLKSEIEVIR